MKTIGYKKLRIVCYETANVTIVKKGKVLGVSINHGQKPHFKFTTTKNLPHKNGEVIGSGVLIAERRNTTKISEDTMTYYQSQFRIEMLS